MEIVLKQANRGEDGIGPSVAMGPVGHLSVNGKVRTREIDLSTATTPFILPLHIYVCILCKNISLITKRY